jgi:hypothetical protein
VRKVYESSLMSVEPTVIYTWAVSNQLIMKTETQYQIQTLDRFPPHLDFMFKTLLSSFMTKNLPKGAIVMNISHRLVQIFNLSHYSR